MTTLNVRVVKAKTTIPFDTEKDIFDDETYAKIFQLGVEAYINGGASKVTKANYDKPEELAKAAVEKATERVEHIRTGKLKIAGQKASKGASGAVMTEARRLARNIIKDAIRAEGGKVSHYEASEITKAANAYLETDEGKATIALATENLAKGQTKIAGAKAMLGGIKVNPALVQKAEAKKKAAKVDSDQASAKQAGKVVPAKPKGGKVPVPPAKPAPAQHATH